MDMGLGALRAYGAVLRAIRPNSGLTRLCHNKLVGRLAAGLPPTVMTRTLEGVRIEVDPQDYHGRVLLLTGSNDFKVSRTVNALLREGDVLLDIGANYSTIGLSAAAKVGPAGHVHLFEPQPFLSGVVQAAIDGAGLGDRVSLHRVALHRQDGEMDMYAPAWHSGMASIALAEAPSRHWRRSRVEVRSTHDYVSDLLEGRGFGVKIDVEGAEPDILPGLLETGGMKFCVFEGANNIELLFDFFKGNGFHVHGLSRTVLAPRVVPVKRIEDWRRFHDFVAVPGAVAVPKGEISLRRLAAEFHRAAI